MAHPLLTDMLLIQARLKLRRQGFSRGQINSVMDGVTGDTIQSLADSMGISVEPPAEVADAGADPIPPAPAPVPKPHPLIDWIKQFLASPAGRALMAQLMQMLLHLLIP